MRKFVKLLSVLVTGASVALLLPSCTAINPAPVVDRSASLSLQQPTARNRMYRYEVKSGDTLYAISKLHGLTVDQVAAMNGIKPPYVIQPGQFLVVDSSRLFEPPQVAAPVPSNQSQSRVAFETPPRQTSPNTTSTPTQTVASSNVVNKQITTRTQPRESVTQAAPAKSNPTSSSELPHVAVSTPLTDSKRPGDDPPETQSMENLPRGWEWPVNKRPTKSDEESDGLSYTLNRGTHVVAAASGRVSYAGVALSDYRYMILVKTPDEYVVQYDFNTELSVEENDVVSKGQPLIRITNQGKGEDDEQYRQLYFAVWRKGVPQDLDKLIGNN